MLMVTSSLVEIIVNSFYCLLQKRSACVQVKEPLAFVLIVFSKRKKSIAVIHKNGCGCLRERSLTRAFHYRF